MGLIKFINKKITQSRIKSVMPLLQNEYCMSYSAFCSANDKIYKENQEYAEIMYHLLDYYKDKDIELCHAILDIISKYGKELPRYDEFAQSYLSKKQTICLVLPESIKEKLNNLKLKLDKDKENDINKEANFLGNFTK